MRRRLLDRILPDAAFRGIGFVAYRINDGWVDPHSLIASGGFALPSPPLRAMVIERWRPWPSIKDLLPVFSAPRGGITYR